MFLMEAKAHCEQVWLTPFLLCGLCSVGMHTVPSSCQALLRPLLWLELFLLEGLSQETLGFPGLHRGYLSQPFLLPTPCLLLLPHLQ